MFNISNSSVVNNSIFRKINPSFKFIIFIFCVLMFFVPAGFFGQIIMVTFMITCISIAKLSKKTYINIFKTFLIMTAIFTLINWITIKDPMAVYINGVNGFGPLRNLPFIISSNEYGYNNDILMSNVLGGNVIKQEIMKDHINYFLNDNNYSVVSKWIKNIDKDVLNTAYDKIGSNLYNGSEKVKNVILYILNNEYTIDGIKYNSYAVLNIPSDWHVSGIIVNPNAVIKYTTNWYSIGYMAFFRSINISIKVMLIICSSVLLTSTTTPSELTNGIEKLFSPLKIIKFPANQVALVLSIGIRFIPSLLNESRRILNAQASRGLDFYNGNLWVKIKALISLVIPLFTISINRSYDLANAMDARGFDPNGTRTKYRVISTHYYDYIYAAIVIFIGSLLLFLWCYKFVFLPFGLVELEMVL